jgi:hypothetical protein
MQQLKKLEQFTSLKPIIVNQSALIKFSQCKMLFLHIDRLKSETFFVEGIAL